MSQPGFALARGTDLEPKLRLDHGSNIPWVESAEVVTERVQDRYNLSVPNVIFSNLRVPTVPQNQSDSLTSTACHVFDLLLEVLSELLIALSGHHGERVHVKPAQAFALLVHAEPQAAPDGLAALALGAHLAQGADLEDVRVVPAFAQRRVGEDELQGRLEAEQLLLVPHDEIVGVIVGLRVATRVLEKLNGLRAHRLCLKRPGLPKK